MSEPITLNSASDVLNDLLDEAGAVSTSGSGILQVLRRYERVLVEGSEHAEGDGFLFQYGILPTIGQGGFIINFTRQLETVDAQGDHEEYTHVLCDREYPPDEDLVAVGKRALWWFRGTYVPFEEWLKEVEHDPVWAVLAERPTPTWQVSQSEV